MHAVNNSSNTNTGSIGILLDPCSFPGRISGVRRQKYLMIDSGACVSCTKLGEFADAVDNSQREDLCSITGERMKHHGKQVARGSIDKVMPDGTTHAVGATFHFNVTNAEESILAMAAIMDEADCDLHFMRRTPSYMENDAGEKTEVVRYGKRFYLPVGPPVDDHRADHVIAGVSQPFDPSSEVAPGDGPEDPGTWEFLRPFNSEDEIPVEEELLPDDCPLEALLPAHVPTLPLHNSYVSAHAAHCITHHPPAS